MTSVVLFDLDDTLFAHRDAVAAGILAHRTAHGLLGEELAELARWNELEELHYHRYLAGELDFFGQRRERARDFVQPHGIVLADSDADAWFDRYFLEYQRAWRLHDDALRALDALDGLGMRLGIITNGDAAFQEAKIEAVGLAGRFEHVVASGALGIAKPDPRIFLHAVGLFGVEPSSAAYVGDRLHTDAIGAAHAGLAGVWLSREGDTSEERTLAADDGVPVIRTLDELPGVL